MQPRRVLVFPGGTEIALEVHRALGWCKEVSLLAAGADVSSHMRFVFNESHVLPMVNDPEWLPAMRELVSAQAVDYIIPAHDDALLAVAEHAGQLPGVITSPVETCRITRSKLATYAHLSGVVRTPRVLDPGSVDTFPVVVKPDIGQGSQGMHVVDSREELDFRMAEDPTRIVLECLPGREYTVDCFSDREEGLLFCGGRERIRTRAGISMDSQPVTDPRFRELAEAIAQRLELHGAWFFQLKHDVDGALALLEVAPRIAGTSALYRAMGVNFPLLSIFEHERLPLKVLVNDAVVRIDRALVNRYRHDLAFTRVYVDLDDTLVVRGRVNTELVSLLYQCVDRGIRVCVLTRHVIEPAGTLRRHRLSELPDEVIHLTAGEPKSSVIDTTGGAIFIDDSFSERLEVAERLGIPTFDCSMIELLIDARV